MKTFILAIFAVILMSCAEDKIVYVIESAPIDTTIGLSTQLQAEWIPTEIVDITIAPDTLIFYVSTRTLIIKSSVGWERKENLVTYYIQFDSPTQCILLWETSVYVVSLSTNGNIEWYLYEDTTTNRHAGTYTKNEQRKFISSSKISTQLHGFWFRVETLPYEPNAPTKMEVNQSTMTLMLEEKDFPAPGTRQYTGTYEVILDSLDACFLHWFVDNGWILPIKRSETNNTIVEIYFHRTTGRHEYRGSLIKE